MTTRAALVVAVAVTASACGGPPAVNATAKPTPTLTPHPSIASTIRAVRLAPCRYAPDEKPDGAAPAHVALLLGAGRADPAPCAMPDDEHPTVYVFPAADFEYALSGTAAELATLADLLTRRPTRLEADPPFIPFVDASMAYVERVRYVDFPGGSGILFLTEWAIEPDTLVRRPRYVFEGLSQDRRRYVLGVFPVTTTVAVPAFAWTSDDIAVASARHEPYRAEVAAALAAADEAAFTPQAGWIAATLATLRL